MVKRLMLADEINFELDYMDKMFYIKNGYTKIMSRKFDEIESIGFNGNFILGYNGRKTEFEFKHFSFLMYCKIRKFLKDLL